MREYKFYFIKQDGHISGPPVVKDFADDWSAIAQAKALAEGCDIEVWEGSRVVAYLTPPSSDL